MSEKKELRQIVGKNLLALRKSQKKTQTEIADLFGYSDKAISKWENGDTMPDIETLYKLANYYNVTLDFLTSEHEYHSRVKYISQMNRAVIINNALIELLSCSIVWVLATIIYVCLLNFSALNYWQIFIWAFPVTFIIAMLFYKVWRNRLYNFIIASLFFWSLIVASYVQFIAYNVWSLFLLMIPIQIALILSFLIKEGLRLKK